MYSKTKSKRKKRNKIWGIFKISAAVLLIFLAIDLFVIASAFGSVDGKVPKGDFDCIAVLGAGVNPDHTPSPMLKDRLDKGIELYNRGAAKKLLLTGDNGQVEYNEVEVMKDYVLAAGVPKKDIFLDHAGFSTYESVYRADKVFAVRKMIIVTQQYHEYRAVYIAKKLGMDACGISAASPIYRGAVMREMREVLARIKDFGKCMYKPRSKYLGEVIDIKGDGRKTW